MRSGFPPGLEQRACPHYARLNLWKSSGDRRSLLDRHRLRLYL
ncbi:hypothetical protein EKH55_0543 [Sinorhizobium alkalisoli]|nr:hypothetical protein EKH55_0543 [Sinorhizobium alkalisoli]